MVGGISFGGLASGLDTTTIINQLVSLERIPINQLETQKSAANQKISLVGTFKGLVKKLQDQANELKTESSFLAYTATPSVEGVATFEVNGEATAGTHTLEVQQLAAADVWAFDGVADSSTDLATGAGQTVSFTVGGNAYEITLDETASSLDEIAAAINDAAGDDVSASVVNTGTSAAPSHQLVLTAKASGEDARIADLATTVGGLSFDATVGGSSNVTQGRNAVAVVDGLTVTREDNAFSGVLQGVSFDLVGTTGSGQSITFAVESDADTVKSRVKDFVQAYNDVMEFINAQNTYSEDSGAGGPLFGDSLLRSVRREINSALFGVDLATVQADTIGYSTLGLVGVDTNSDGTLTLDETTFDAKLAENPGALMDLFVDTDGFDNGDAEPNTAAYYTDQTADSGLADRLSRAIDRMFKSFSNGDGQTFKGLFQNRTDALHKEVDRLTGQIDTKESALERFQEQLVQRFSVLEQTMGALNAQGAALTGALSGLNFQN